MTDDIIENARFQLTVVLKNSNAKENRKRKNSTAFTHAFTFVVILSHMQTSLKELFHWIE